MTRHVSGVEPLQCEDARTRPDWSPRTYGHNPLFQARCALLRLPLGACRFAHRADPRHDRGQVVRIECENTGRRGQLRERSDGLVLGHRADVTDALRDDEIGSGCGDSREVKLVYAAVIAQCCADRGIDLSTR